MSIGHLVSFPLHQAANILAKLAKRLWEKKYLFATTAMLGYTATVISEKGHTRKSLAFAVLASAP